MTIDSNCAQIETSFGVMVSEGGIGPERPDAVKAWVIHWPDAGLVIPWPVGRTLREAVAEWLDRGRTDE